MLHMLRVAALLAAVAERDSTVTGGTIILPTGELRWLSVGDAKAMLGLGPAAGSA